MTFTANELLTYILNCDAGLAGYDDRFLSRVIFAFIVRLFSLEMLGFEKAIRLSRAILVFLCTV